MQLPTGTNDGFQYEPDKANCSLLQSFGVLTLLSVLIAGPAFLIIRLLEPGLILPALSILLFSYAAIVAIAAYSSHADWNSANVTLWNISGAFTMMGCATAIFSEPDQVAQFFEPLAEQHFDAPRQETVTRRAPPGS